MRRRTIGLSIFTVLTFLVLALWGCGGSDRPTEDVSALDGASGVAVNSTFVYSFETSIDTGTLATSNFFVLATPTASTGIAKSADGSKSTDSSTCNSSMGLGATASCASPKRCTLTPSKHLSANKSYTICMTETIKYENGEPFEGRTVAFTTGDGRGDYAGDRTHFSDSTYSVPNTDTRAARLASVDTTATKNALSDVNNILSPTSFRGSSLLFDECLIPDYASGNYTQEILVPEDYDTIQEAVDNADDYQTIVISESSYTENIRVRQKFLHIVAADSTKLVELYPADTTEPIITFDCNGGGLVRDITFRNGSIAIKADATTKGTFSVIDSSFYNVETGIVSNGNDVLISGNDFTLITKDAIDLFKSTGQVISNMFVSVGWTAVYSEGSSGLDVSSNTISGQVGQASVIVRGGAASIDYNVFPLEESALGIFAEYDDNAPNTAIEICGNTITKAAGAGIIVFGSGGEKTVATICDNTIQYSVTAETNAKLDWLAYTSSNGEVVTEYRTAKAGIAVSDAKADTSNNNVSHDTRGVMYKRSCGTVSGNTMDDNTFGLVYLISDDTDGCSKPTFDQVTCTNVIQQCIASDQGLSVPPPPSAAPVPQSP